MPVLLHRAREALALHFRDVLTRNDLTDAQWRVLRILDEFDEIDVSTLARKSYLLRESLSRILRDFGARGLIVRDVSTKDGRRFLHSLTPKGRCLIENVAPEFNPAFSEIEVRLGLTRIQAINEQLRDLLDAIAPASEKTLARRSS